MTKKLAIGNLYKTSRFIWYDFHTKLVTKEVIAKFVAVIYLGQDSFLENHSMVLYGDKICSTLTNFLIEI